MKKIFMFLPVALLGATTISNGTLTLDSSGLASMGTALQNGGASLLTTLINLAPYLIGLAIAGIVFAFIRNLISPKF